MLFAIIRNIDPWSKEQVGPTRYRFEGVVVGEDDLGNTLYRATSGRIFTCYRSGFSFGLNCIVRPD